MKVFKFGGASVKDTASVKNIAVILGRYSGNLLVVVSAMGKTTNALERLLKAYLEGNKQLIENEFRALYDYHMNMAIELIPDPQHILFTELRNIFADIENKMEAPSGLPYNQEYDQLVSLGEIISTIIVSNYLNYRGIINQWTDARQFLKTDSTFREGRVNWNLSDRLIKEQFDFRNTRLYVTQGFIGSALNNQTTTLGREGSDYTAAILAYILDAESVTVWKDVPGVLNADPKWFDNTVCIDNMSYADAIELAYYGASVIHPKTIQPLKNKGIRLFVKSFLHPEYDGTLIGNVRYEKLVPSFIFKMNQVLIHIQPDDFSFIAEDNLERIFRLFAGFGLKINLMQNSAISFDVCVNNDEHVVPDVLLELNREFKVKCTEWLELITIRYYDEETIERVIVNKELILTQRTAKTVQMVVKDLGNMKI